MECRKIIYTYLSTYVQWACVDKCLHSTSFLNLEELLLFDPLGQPKVMAVGIIVFAHVVRPSPLFKSRKTKQQKTMFATGVTMGLAEWIIDDTCLLSCCFERNSLAWKFLVFSSPIYFNLWKWHFKSLVGMRMRKNKTSVINDPLGQSHSLASSEHCFRVKFVLFC